MHDLVLQIRIGRYPVIKFFTSGFSQTLQICNSRPLATKFNTSFFSEVWFIFSNLQQLLCFYFTCL